MRLSTACCYATSSGFMIHNPCTHIIVILWCYQRSNIDVCSYVSRVIEYESGIEDNFRVRVRRATGWTLLGLLGVLPDYRWGDLVGQPCWAFQATKRFGATTLVWRTAHSDRCKDLTTRCNGNYSLSFEPIRHIHLHEGKVKNYHFDLRHGSKNHKK